MAYTPEFFKQRSFEVVWAVFRVADVCNRSSIARLLEDRALTYFIHKNLVTLEDMHEAILLGSKIGEIHEMNVAVLEREIQDLREFLSQPVTASVESSTPAFIDDVFSEPSSFFSTFAQPANSNKNRAPRPRSVHREASVVDARGLANEFSESGNNTIGAIDNNVIESTYNNTFSFSGNSPANDFPESGNEISGKTETKTSHEISGKSGNDISAQLLTSAQRKEFIVSLLKNKQFCHIKDILAQLPQVSDRTIRNDIHSLAESRIIERLGNGGPNSFFRLKKGGNS